MYRVYVAASDTIVVEDSADTVRGAVFAGIGWLEVYPGATFNVYGDGPLPLIADARVCGAHNALRANVLRGSVADDPDIIATEHNTRPDGEL